MCIWRVHLQKSDISARRRMYYEGEKKKTADFYEQVVVVQFDAIDATYVSRHTNVSLHSIEFPMGRFALQNIAVSTSHCT